AHVPGKRAIRTPDDERQRESCDQVFARGPRSKTSIAMGCRKCEKPRATYRKGLWSPEEDETSIGMAMVAGARFPPKLVSLCDSVVKERRRGGAQRWLDYLRPGLKHGTFSPLEVETVAKLHSVSILITFKFAR
ncbi:unnamed protein product, partial [Musa acuminata subsp. burmannicoides]